MLHQDTTRPFAPWDTLFSPESRITLPRGVDVVVADSEIRGVYFVESGAVVEIKTDAHKSSHAVSFCGPGTIIGIPHSADAHATYGIRATTLIPTTLRVVTREEFVFATHHDSLLTQAVLKEIARRTQDAGRLTDSCQHGTTTMHVLALLESVSSMFGSDADGRSNVCIPPALLERMCGCPWVMVRTALTELTNRGLVAVEPEGVRLEKFLTA
jgi:CRP-like cAMP-binding protein